MLIETFNTRANYKISLNRWSAKYCRGYFFFLGGGRLVDTHTHTHTHHVHRKVTPQHFQ